MQKIDIKLKINDYNIEEEGILENNILKVKTDKEYIEYDLNNNILLKEDKDLKIEMDFINKEIKYHLLKENKIFSNFFNIISLTNNDKKVIINYQIEQTSFLLEIEYKQKV